jgi:hypothetical protein
MAHYLGRGMCMIVAGLARLRGTVALVLQKHFGIGQELPVPK